MAAQLSGVAILTPRESTLMFLPREMHKVFLCSEDPLGFSVTF